MKNTGLSWYGEFTCLGRGCPETCCRGWGITLDDTTYRNVKETKGIKGLLLRASVKLMGGELPVFRNVGFRCPYQKMDGLCRFQKKGEFCYLPKICRVYPRRSTFYGDRCEVMFELSCVEAARLFLEHTERQAFVELPGEDPLIARYDPVDTERVDVVPQAPAPADAVKNSRMDRLEYTWILQNEDPGFREFLRRDREKLLDRLWESGRSLEQAMADIYSYVWDLEKLILGGRILEAEEMQQALMPYVEEGKINVPFYSVTLLNDLIYQYLNEPELFFRNRPLFHMIRSYQRIYGGLWEAEADAFFLAARRKLTESGTLPKDKYRGYFSYCLQELYCEAYEDYYLLGPVLLSLIYTEFLMLFDTAVFLYRGHLSREEQATNLAALEKGIRHSIRTREEFLQKIRRDFL